MRSDPTDTGGLFMRRRPGSQPVRYLGAPTPSRGLRRAFDEGLALAVAALMCFISLLYWGPAPMAAMWVASNTAGENVALWIGVAFVLILVLLMGGLVVLRQLDQLWILVRRAAGRDQRTGIVGPVFGTMAVIGGSAFVFWLLILEGPAPSGVGL